MCGFGSVFQNGKAFNIRRVNRGEYTQVTKYSVNDYQWIVATGLVLGLFMLILAIVSTAIIALIIYTMTMSKIKEIAVLKLIGAKNSTIAGMILQEAWA